MISVTLASTKGKIRVSKVPKKNTVSFMSQSKRPPLGITPKAKYIVRKFKSIAGRVHWLINTNDGRSIYVASQGTYGGFKPVVRVS